MSSPGVICLTCFVSRLSPANFKIISFSSPRAVHLLARSRKQPLRGIKPTSGATLTGHSGRSPARASSCLLYSAHPIDLNLTSLHMRGKSNPLKLGLSKHSKSARACLRKKYSFRAKKDILLTILFEGVLQFFPLSVKVHIPVNGAVRVRGLGSRLSRLSWLPVGSVSSPCFTPVCLTPCRSGCLFSRVFLLFFTSPASLRFSVSIPPTLMQHPPVPPFHPLTPPLQHTGCFLVCCHRVFVLLCLKILLNVTVAVLCQS